MAHGEAEPGCADAGSRPHEGGTTPSPTAGIGRQIRRVCAEPTAERTRTDHAGDDGPAAPLPDHVAGFSMAPDRPGDGVPAQGGGRAPACRSERPGWAGAHRHGAVRPRRRPCRRERPPDRWC